MLLQALDAVITRLVSAGKHVSVTHVPVYADTEGNSFDQRTQLREFLQATRARARNCVPDQATEPGVTAAMDVPIPPPRTVPVLPPANVCKFEDNSLGLPVIVLRPNDDTGVLVSDTRAGLAAKAAARHAGVEAAAASRRAMLQAAILAAMPIYFISVITQSVLFETS